MFPFFYSTFYISKLSSITKLDKKEVYVIVIKNLMDVNNGIITYQEAYCNISNQLTSYVINKKQSEDDKIVKRCVCI